MLSLFKKKPNEPVLDKCISCNLPILDNPYYVVYFKDMNGKTFVVRVHNSPEHEDCFSIVDIKNKFPECTYLNVGMEYKTARPKKK
jgi:hypothetical protein